MLHKYARDEDPSPTNLEEVDFFKDRPKSPPIDPKMIAKARKNKLGKIGEYVVYEMDDEYIRNNIDIDAVMGCNFARDSYVPEGEIWVSKFMRPSDYGPTLVHECVEVMLMTKFDIEYGDAHDYANMFEARMRRKIVSKEITIKNNADAFKHANKMVKKFIDDAITKL